MSLVQVVEHERCTRRCAVEPGSVGALCSAGWVGTVSRSSRGRAASSGVTQRDDAADALEAVARIRIEAVAVRDGLFGSRLVGSFGRCAGEKARLVAFEVEVVVGHELGRLVVECGARLVEQLQALLCAKWSAE